ncbi:uncharacterized protein L203_103172 [Cryptococcus depauperatus CBS 7841]|uniref:Uncharacterized protein n=1 Tax=Cryptococcus depauperatus CBS 7841 TaxID=1295531 RepID=A0AAJ8M110_9TREE
MIIDSLQKHPNSSDLSVFHEDGTVGYVLIDAVGSVMEAIQNSEMGELWHELIFPQSFGVEPTRCWGFRNIGRLLDLSQGSVWDRTGLEGSWRSSYAFLDYSDCMSLNEPELVLLRERAAPLDLTRYHEAIGDLMYLNLTLDEPSSLTFKSYGLPSVTTNLPTSSFLPALHFVGDSRQNDNSQNTSFIRDITGKINGGWNVFRTEGEGAREDSLAFGLMQREKDTSLMVQSGAGSVDLHT